jgi:glycolate oxidase iron-sulfur subunit
VNAHAAKTPAGVLGLDPDLLNACVSCGLCLPHCPTYRATEEESASPRGRITMMRAADSGELAIDDDFVSFMERCVMCRGCETACPSGVQFGSLMEQTRISLANQGKIRIPIIIKCGLRALEHHRLLSIGSSFLGMAQKFGLVPERLRRRIGLPKTIPIRNQTIPRAAGEPDVWLFTGCVMDVWQRDVHVATKRVLEMAGAQNVSVPRKGGDCCGALHLHVGRKHDGIRLAKTVMNSMPGGAPIVVNSAGCGAALKDYGHLVGTAEAIAFSKRAVDVSEWLGHPDRLDRLPYIQPSAKRARLVVAVQDPCHLRHVQKAHPATRKVLERFVDIREVADDGRCCGAGGSYSVLQPELAEVIRIQKISAVRATGATTIASANPGCSIWLSNAPIEIGQDKLRFAHPMTLIVEALNGAFDE